MNGLGDCEHSCSLLLCVGRGLVIVVGRMMVAMLADVEVEVEETGAERAVPMPIACGVQAQTADAEDDGHAQDRAGQPGTSDYGSAQT